LSDAGDFKLLAPLPRPRAIYALGRNYPAHARESGVDVPEEPIVFAKAPTSVIGHEDDVVYKKWLTRVDPEAELAVVIGKQGSNIPVEQAPDYIAGYTCLNDVTARDIQKKDLANAHPWLRSKGIDTFCPMGPWLVLTDEIRLPLELDIELRVNGEVRQKDNTRSMTFDVPYLISWISRFHTLYPGDVISTGTPEGMKPVFPGDVMEVEVEGIGVLRNRVVSE
jgi:2-keto-4-pentenoate hydratase/2-oxohepta-3-ene-1,7-dioic acid hydratase in catechol pathway